MGVIAKYKFNNTLEANLLPEFNSEFTSDLYTVTDEVNGEVTIRTIESDSLPTLMRFGRVYVAGESATDNRTDSLLEVLDMNTSGLTSCHSMFRYCANLTSITCEWDTSKVTSMYGTFSSCTNLTSLDVSNFNTNKVTTMHYTFWGCNNLTSLDVSKFNTSKVTSMNGMFLNCTKLTSLDVSNWNTSNVNNMNGIFANCNNLNTLDVSNWDTSNVTDMYQMFRDCSSLVSLDVSRFDTSKVTTMYCMFYNCRNLAELDVSNWNTSNVESMYSMFCNCIRLLFLDISKWDTSKNVNMDYMFSGYNYDMNLVSLDINNFNIDNINRDYSHLFERMPYLKYLKCKNTNVLNTLLPYLPTKSSTSQGTIICKSDTTNLDTTTLQSKNWNILDEPTLIAKYVFDKSIHNNCIPEFNTEFEGYFIEDEVVEGNSEVIRTIESCGMLPTLMRFGQEWVIHEVASNKSLSLLEVLNINTEQLTTAKDMFRNCANVKNICIHISSKVDSIYGIFENCNKLEKVDVSEWNTSRVTNMYCVFGSCSKLKKVDVSKWDTSQVTNMSYLFLNCWSLTSINVSNFNTSKVTTTYGIFQNCAKLTSLDVSNFDISKVTDTADMFSNTPLLTDIGVLYMDKSSLQKLVDAMPTDSNKTLWYKDVNIDGITHGDNITLKKYMEENVEIVLNSPLLEGDRIEVKDGRLCHYHKMGMVVFDGSEDEGWELSNTFYVTINIKNMKKSNIQDMILCNTLRPIYGITVNTPEVIGIYVVGNLAQIRIRIDSINSNPIQWLSENPTTVIYELAEPWYEDITNLQSAPTLKTYLECSMEIDTNLPIDTNVTYRTNLSSVYVMERELDELDNGIDLGDILEGEVNE